MKTKILLKWNEETGKYKKFILNPALQKPKNDDEEHFIVSEYIGVL